MRASAGAAHARHAEARPRPRHSSGAGDPGPVDVLLIVLLAPIALAAGFLDAMARQPRMTVVGAVVAAAATALVMDSAWWCVPIAACEPSGRPGCARFSAAVRPMTIGGCSSRR